jgi:predicted permease
VAFHLECQTQDLIAAGVAPAEARRQATLLLGGMEQTKEACRDARGTRWLEDFFSDCRYGIRVLRRSPAFTCAAVASLALGIGANTAIFSLVDLVVLRRMPVREPDRLVEFQKFHPTYGRGNISYPQFEQFQQELRSFDAVLAYSQARREIKIGGRPEDVNVELVSGSYYGVLGVPAIAGRTFGTETDRVAGGSPVAVITDSYWKKRFGSDPSALGSSFQLNQTVFTIIGVTPPGFTGVVAGRIPDITVPIAMDGEVRGGRSWLKSPNFNWLSVMGRLRNGQSLAQARSEVKTIFARMAADDAARTDKATLKSAAMAQRMELEPAGNGFDELRRRFSEPLGILMGVVALVLLIACANIANLLLAKAAARSRNRGPAAIGATEGG